MRVMLTALAATIALAASGCGSEDDTDAMSDTAASTQIAQSQSAVDGAVGSSSDQAKGFLGLPDDAIRTIGDEHPESALCDITSISKVEDSTFETYSRLKTEGRIDSEERRNGYVYYAVQEDRHIPFPDGTRAFVTVTERYKVRQPQ